MENKVYSYHTFVLPFIWEGEASKRISMKKFVRIFEDNPNWQDTNLNEENKFPDFSLRSDGTDELLFYDDLLFYKEYQYFHPYVRRAIYGTEPTLVRNFSFMPGNVNNKGKYYIEKSKYIESTNRTVTRKYMLTLNGIKLKIFNTGVALFIVECENHGVDAEGKSQASIEDVKNINDYGRRISLPFVPNEYKTASCCADKLTIEIPGVPTLEDDYGSFIQSIINANPSDKEVNDKETNGKRTIPRDVLSLTHISDWIKEILGFGSSYRFTSKRDGQPSSVFIYPALDDRMFVACCVCEDKKVVNDWKAEKNGDYAFLTDDEQSMSLYEFAFVDPGMFEGEAERNCTCISKKMRTSLLSDHVYDRWLLLGKAQGDYTNYGTIYTISNQGFMMATNFRRDYLIESFLTQYIQMCCLVLTQRATLIHFQREAA